MHTIKTTPPCACRYGPASRGPPSPTADGKCVGHMHADDDALKFENVIWTCSTMFNSDTRRSGGAVGAYMMTNDTDPSRGNASSWRSGAPRTSRMQASGSTVFFQPPPPATLDLSTGSFWFDFVSAFRKRSTEEDVAGGGGWRGHERAWTKTTSAARSRAARPRRAQAAPQAHARQGDDAAGAAVTVGRHRGSRSTCCGSSPVQAHLDQVAASDPTKTLKSDRALSTERQPAHQERHVEGVRLRWAVGLL